MFLIKLLSSVIILLYNYIMSFRESILNNCDIFANPFYFKVKGHDKLGTKAGLFVTILVCFIGIGSLVYMIDDM